MSTRRQSIHSIHNKKFWTEFFYLYESLPALWDMNNPLYKNRQVKCDAYDIMVEKLREIEPNADREDVLRKINIFRTNYRRECSRINISLQEGRHYQSTLWYFDLLCFLQTDTRKDRKRKLVDDDGEKSIMRKRRPNHMMQRSSEEFIVPTKKDIIEYQPHSSHDFDYDLDEEADFDYVPDELEHDLVDEKNDDSNSEIQQSHNYHEADDNRNQHHQEYNHQQEYENFTLQRTNNATHDNRQKSEIVIKEAKLEIVNESLNPEVFHEYTSEEAQQNEPTHTIQWCTKTASVDNTNGDNHQKQEQSATTMVRINDTTSASNKFFRDVKTMTTAKHIGCCSKISESSEILAKSWAIQIDELTQDQKILARKAINDILFEACMGHLVINSNGRITTNNTNEYKNLKSAKDSNTEEVESGEVYKKVQVSTSTTAATTSLNRGNSIALTLTDGETTTSKIHSTNDWLKL